MATSTEFEPTGTINVGEDVFVEGGPDLWFGGVKKHSPDANGFFWGITGTAGTPVFKVGCYENFQLADNLTINDVQCDNVGIKGETVRRNFLEATFDLQVLFPLTQLDLMLRLGSSLLDATADTEYASIGEVVQDVFHNVFFSRIYDAATGDWVSVTGHRCSFRWNAPLQTRYGEKWMVGVAIKFFADENLPAAQRFATMVRWDPSAL